MPKGKSGTPGPFSLAVTAPLGLIGEYHIIQEDGRWHLTFLDETDQATRNRLCDLLNKGTHFEGMLEALREVWSECASGDPREVYPPHPNTMIAIRAAIAKAEGREGESDD